MKIKGKAAYAMVFKLLKENFWLKIEAIDFSLRILNVEPRTASMFFRGTFIPFSGRWTHKP